MTDTSVESESIGRKAGRGLGWGLLGNLAIKVGSFTTGLALARLLAPQDFGTYAVALAATQLVIHVNDVGIIPATIQWRGRLDAMAPTATTAAFLFSVVAYVGFWISAPAFAHMSGVPAATPVIRLFTATILIDGFTAVRSAYLLRTFQQRRYVQANVAGIVANGVVAIGLALAGAGAMSLAAGQVASSLASGALVFLWARLPLRVGFKRQVFRQLMAYGVALALHRAGVPLGPIPGRLVRPMLAGVFTGAVALLLARAIGPSPFMQLVVAGTGGLLAYLATGMPREEMRGWLAALRAGRTHAVAE